MPAGRPLLNRGSFQGVENTGAGLTHFLTSDDSFDFAFQGKTQVLPWKIVNNPEMRPIFTSA
jgi:hypothetical protein